MRSKKRLLKSWRTYPILDSGMFVAAKVFKKKYLDILSSGADAVEIRCKKLDGLSLGLIKWAAAGVRRKKIALIVNDRPEFVLMYGYDGVHLGKGDIPPALARKLLGRSFIIGRTIRNKTDLLSLGRADIDYVAIGPVFHSPLKGALRRVSAAGLKEVCRLSKKPVIAIGGITADNVDEVKRAGVRAVSFMRYAVRGKNTAADIERLKKRMDKAD